MAPNHRREEKIQSLMLAAKLALGLLENYYKAVEGRGTIKLLRKAIEEMEAENGASNP
jgi:hypothetical protein